jgi:hypothetical protein
MTIHNGPHIEAADVRQMPCPERTRLLQAYAGASGELADLVADVARSAHSADRAFEKAWSACEVARSKCHQVQQRIYEHVRAHGCALEIARSGASRP